MATWTKCLAASSLQQLYRLLAAVETRTRITQTSRLLQKEGVLGVNVRLEQPIQLEGAEEPWTTGTPVLATSRRLLPLTGHVLLMGILNLTPDSFYDGGKYTSLEAAYNQAVLLLQQGADILDIGAESTRPNAQLVSLETELERLLPVIVRLRADPRFASTLISVDTYKPEVARQALNVGADIINDVWGGPAASAAKHVPYILMHSRGTSKTMDSLTSYPAGVTAGVIQELRERIATLRLYDFNVILDPGLGFAKTNEQNWELLRGLHSLQTELPYTWLLGHSNKRFVREFGLPAANYVVAGAALQAGVEIIRVHDVGGHAAYLRAASKLRTS